MSSGYLLSCVFTLGWAGCALRDWENPHFSLVATFTWFCFCLFILLQWHLNKSCPSLVAINFWSDAGKSVSNRSGGPAVCINLSIDVRINQSNTSWSFPQDKIYYIGIQNVNDRNSMKCGPVSAHWASWAR